VPLPAACLPFGLLALANATSLAAGMALLRLEHAPPVPVLAGSAEELRRSGAWLLLTGVLPNGTAVLAGMILTQVSGPGALGYLEAARLVAQPILVFAAGLNAVLGPRSMHAAISLQAERARRLSRQFTTLIALVGIGYALAFGVPHALNLFARLSPKAFTVPWIAMLMIVAHVALSLSLPERSELLGVGRSRALASIEAVASLASLACAFLAVVLGVVALPIALLVQGLLRWVLLRSRAARHYRPAASPASLNAPSGAEAEWPATIVALPDTPA
jgi:O-antigen/teichoic acid export membrane protein